MDTEIEEVNQEIRKVQQQIDDVEGQLTKAVTEADVAYWRKKEEQLRKKEEQLRNKELLLLEANTSDKCTEYEWLRQNLPLCASGRGVKTPSTTQKERMHTPAKVEFWDVEGDIKGFLEKADRLKRKFQKVDSLTATRGRRNVVNVAGSVVASTCDFVTTKQSGSSVLYELEARLELPPTPVAGEGNSENLDKSRSEDKEVARCLYYGKSPRVDILVKSNDKGVAVFELKNGGLGCPVRISTLWARCSCRTGNDFNCWCNSGITKGEARSLLNCILQVYEYLVLAKVGYGVLTDIQNWYLFKRDHAGCLYISDCFKWDDRQPPLPAAIGYLVSCAVDALGEFDVSPEEGERPWSWEVTPSTSPSGGSKDDEDMDPSYHPKENRVGSSETSLHWTGKVYSRRRQLQKQLQEIPALDLHLDDRPITDEGWSGCVVGGCLNGRRVAVKFAPRKSKRAEALLNEVEAYLKLQEHWGVFVPPLIGYGTTARGQIVYIATELIYGSTLGPATVTEEVATAALQALDAVHACKLLHGDIEARNIMVLQGTQPSVRLVDFGFAQCSSNRNSQKAELRKLQYLLEDMMGVGVGKESTGVQYPHKQLCLV